MAATVAGCGTSKLTTGSISRDSGKPVAEMSAGELAKRGASLGKSYAANPSDKPTAMRYAQLLQMNGRTDQSLAVMRKLAIAYPKDRDVLAAYGKALAGTGELEPALDAVRRAQTPEYPDWKLLSAEAAILDQLGKSGEARTLYRRALDLLLICIESGMSIEAGFRKVSDEIGTQSIALAEEFTLTTAELSYLQDRKQAYENLAKRTGVDGVKSVCLALMQSERYGTPLGQSLRVMAQENRDMRMNEAEKKAAALPPKLTVPMILFFLPCLFIVILGPTGIKVAAQMN